MPYQEILAISISRTLTIALQAIVTQVFTMGAIGALKNLSIYLQNSSNSLVKIIK